MHDAGHLTRVIETLPLLQHQQHIFQWLVCSLYCLRSLALCAASGTSVSIRNEKVHPCYERQAHPGKSSPNMRSNLGLR